MSISPYSSKSDISNSYLFFYVPSASRYYSAIKMCLKDISYCQREYIHERACAVIDMCGLKSASDWYSSFFRTYLRGKKQLNGCQSKDHSIIHCTVCFRVLGILTIKRSFWNIACPDRNQTGLEIWIRWNMCFPLLTVLSVYFWCHATGVLFPDILINFF